MNTNQNWRILNLALAIIFFDQLTKLLVLRYLDFADEKEVIPGFFKFVHWGNTGAAWSWFLDIFAIACLVFCITGLLILKYHATHRPSTWPLVGFGFVLPALLALLLIH